MITESSLSRVWRKYKESDSGTISACRGDLTKKQNHDRTLQLKTDLLRLGYSVTLIDGTYIENYKKPNARKVREDSFIVFDKDQSGNLRNDLIKLGIKYDQDSITYCDVDQRKYYLIGMNETGYPGKGKVKLLGKPTFGNDGEFYSSVNGRPFVFENVYQGHYNIDCSLTSYNISAIRAIKIFEDYVVRE